MNESKHPGLEFMQQDDLDAIHTARVVQGDLNL